MPMKHAVILFVATLVVVIPAVAFPCSIAPSFGEFEFIEEPPDAPPPATPTVTVTSINRGTGPQSEGCGGQSSSSCDDLGFLHVEIAGLDDGAGVRFEVRGDPPSGLDLPSGAVSVESTSPTLVWIDEANDEQEPIGFEFRTFAIDRWGQESAATDWVAVSDPGRRGGPGGCSTTSSAAGTALTPVLGLIAWRRRRRRLMRS